VKHPDFIHFLKIKGYVIYSRKETRFILDRDSQVKASFWVTRYEKFDAFSTCFIVDF